MSIEHVVRQRLKDDFPFYAKHCLKIRTKGAGLQPLILNRAQLYLHEMLEEQKRETGKIRALIPKGRQMGTSTYTQARFFHHTTHHVGCRTYILTHEADASANIFDMVKRMYDELPDPVKPALSASNVRELVFSALNSGYRVGTAGNTAVGRSQTIQLFHGSEVAYWPSADEHWAGVLETVPQVAGTEIILESTSSGNNGKFYEACQAALNGEGEYKVIFLPWYWDDGYQLTTENPDFRLNAEEIELAAEYDLTDAQLLWRRIKLTQFGISRFRREYPMTVEEAFAADARGALWTRDLIAAHRITADRVPPLRRLVVGLDPAVTAKEKSDKTAMVLVGLGQNNHLYVFRFNQGKYTPRGWASAAVSMVDAGWGEGDEHRKADRIIGETNQGGDLIEDNLRQIRANIGFKGIHVHDAKRVRAEPVATLYEAGMVHHVIDRDGSNGLMALEDEMCTWSAADNDASPNGVDSLTLAITELALNNNTTGILDYYEKQAEMLGIAKPDGEFKRITDTTTRVDTAGDKKVRAAYAALLR